jgi:hypothetical protein
VIGRHDIPCRSTSSAVFTITVSPLPRCACSPCASRAPPTPPARVTTLAVDIAGNDRGSRGLSGHPRHTRSVERSRRIGWAF